MNRSWWLAVVPIVLAAACAPAEEAAESAGAAATSTEADVEAITELLRQYDAGISSGQLDDLMTLYVENAVAMPSEEPAVIGKEAILARLRGFLEEYRDTVSATVEDITVSGDWAFVRASYWESWTPRAGGDATSVVGKWVVIFQRQADGTWRIYNEIWNTDAPLE